MQNNMYEQNVQPNTFKPSYLHSVANWGEKLNWARLDIPAKSENVALARAFLAGVITARPEANWNVELSTMDELKVALSEAVSNAIIHGYAQDGEKQVQIEVEEYQAALLVRVIDNGVGIEDIQRARQPDYTTGQGHLGLGFAFMESFMDKVEVKSAPGVGTVVTLVKILNFDTAVCDV